MDHPEDFEFIKPYLVSGNAAFTAKTIPLPPKAAPEHASAEACEAADKAMAEYKAKLGPTKRKRAEDERYNKFLMTLIKRFGSLEAYDAWYLNTHGVAAGVQNE
jgi:hypothetical protein